MNVVLVMFKDNERREFPVMGDKTVLGRRQDCQLRIPTRDVSRQHCVLLLDGDKVVVKDLGSSNGTYVNGKRIAETELAPGDRLHLGPVTFVVQIDGQPAHIKPADAASPPAAEPDLAGDDVAGDDEEETFDLSENDFDLDDAMSALEDDKEEDDLP